MNEDYKPSPDFVARVMRQVHLFEDQKISFVERFFCSRQLRYALAGGGAVFGILRAIPVF